jgi:hypothetical protein
MPSLPGDVDEVGCDGSADETGRGGCEVAEGEESRGKMIRKAKDPQTRTKISKRFRKLAKKHS